MEPHAEPTIAREARRIKETLDKYMAGRTAATEEVVTDLANAIHDLSDHLTTLDRRLKKLEEDQPEWTTRGWIGPEGTNV